MSRVLVVDDDDLIRELIAGILTHYGHEVRTAGSVDEGLAQFSESPVDLVITDMIMPEKNGLDLIRELKQEAPEVPILALSGESSGSELREKALETGADRTLSKPFDVDELMEAVKTMAATG